MQAIENDESIFIFPDPDPDGIIATVLSMDYLSRLSNKVKYGRREREDGHGVNKEDVPLDTDLLIIVDSSSSEYENVNYLAEHIDVIILDHHNVEESDAELNAILVNPNQKGCTYENKYISGSGVVFRFIELLDFTYKKINTDMYLDLVATSLLSDQMNMSSLENRYFVSKGLSKIYNVGLLALINATRNGNKRLNATIMNFSIIPILNTTTRNNEMHKAFKLLFEKNYFKALKMAKWLVNENNERKEKVKELFNEYQKIAQNERFLYVTTPTATKNYNGLVSQKFSSSERKPSFVLKDNGKSYQGSFRSYNGYDVQSFLKQCQYVEFAAGHAGAGGTEIKIDNWDKFKQYVNENIDEELFEPIIIYDLDVNENELSWELVEDIISFDRIYGNGSSKINVRIHDVFVEDKEIFPPKKQKHVKIKCSNNIELVKFNDIEYASDVDTFDVVDVVGNIDIYEDKEGRSIQVNIEDYIKH